MAGRATPEQPSAKRRSALGASTLGLVVAFAVGALDGRLIAYQASVGGLSGALGAGLLVFATLGGVLLLLFVVAFAGIVRRRATAAAIRRIVLGSAALGAGIAVGNVTAPFTGGVYRQPVVLASTGTITVSLDGLADAYQPTPKGQASCASVADGTDVAEITGLELGLLRGLHLRGTVSLAPGGETVAGVSFWIDGADLPAEVAQPAWSGPITTSPRPSGDRGGVATFDSVTLSRDPKLPQPSGGLPETLRGSVAWTCEPFRP